MFRAQEELSERIVLFENEKLGQGSYGAVYKGLDRKTNKLVAIKRAIGRQAKWSLQEQRKILEKLMDSPHTNIVQMIDVTIQNHIVLQYCEGGSLKTQIKKNRLPISNVFSYTNQIFNGIYFLRQNNVVHRDLKLDNILVTKDKILKIADFGTAKILQNYVFSPLKSQHGTPIYKPFNIDGDNEYTSKCDIWCFGIILYQLLTGKHIFQKTLDIYAIDKQPFHASFKQFQRQIEQLKKVGKKTLQGNFDPFFKDLIENCIIVDQNKRYSVDKIKQLIQKVILSNSISLIKTNPILNLNFNPPNLHQKNIKIISSTKPKRIRIISSNNQTKSIQQSKRIAELQQDSINKQKMLMNYINYLYNIGLIFYDISSKNAQIKDGIQNNCQKIIIQMLEQIIQAKISNKIISLFKQNQIIQLPDGVRFKINQLHKDVQQKLQSLKPNLVQYSQQQIEINHKQIQKNLHKILTPKYQKQYGSLLYSFDHGLTKVKQQYGCKQNFYSLEEYQQIFSIFFKKYYVPEINLLQKQEDIICYWALLILSDIENQFPSKQYNNDYMINGFYERLEKNEQYMFLEEIKDKRKLFKIQ